MILSDADILRRLESGDLVIEPLDDPELQVQPASVDLRLGREFLEFQRTNIPYIHPHSEEEIQDYVTETIVGEGDDFILHPGDFVLGTTKERVEIPPDLIAHVEGRSSLGRLAIVVHASLPYDEPVFLWTPEDGYGFYEIGEIVERERPARAVAFDPKTLRVSTHRVTNYITNPTKRIYRVELESGREVQVTRDHNLFTLDEHGGVTRIPSEDAEGTLVMVPEQLPPSPTTATDGGTVSTETTGTADTHPLQVEPDESSSRLPDAVFDWPEDSLTSLLEELPGEPAQVDSPRVLTTTSERLANRAAYLGTRLGFKTSVTRREGTTETAPIETTPSEPKWLVEFTDHENTPGRVPTPGGVLRTYRRQAGYTITEAAEAMGYASASSVSDVETARHQTIERETLKRFRNAYARAGVDTTRLDQILDGGIRFERVTTVEKTERVEPTYDLEVQPAGQPVENFLGGRFGGIFLSNTAGLCDPGYQGQITLELSNLGTAPVALTPEMRVSQLTFTELTSPADRPYGEERGSKYQDQSGPQASRIGGDREFGGDQ